MHSDSSEWIHDGAADGASNLEVPCEGVTPAVSGQDARDMCCAASRAAGLGMICPYRRSSVIVNLPLACALSTPLLDQDPNLALCRLARAHS